MRSALMMMAAVCLLACGEGESEPKDPESFVPDEVLEQTDDPLVRQCLAYAWVGAARLQECAGSAAPVDPDVELTKCTDAAAVARDPDAMFHAEAISSFEWWDACLDRFANDACDNLNGEDECGRFGRGGW